MRRIPPTNFRRLGRLGGQLPRSPVRGWRQHRSWRGKIEPGGAVEGGPARDPDVEAVCTHPGRFSTCAVDGESHVACGGHVIKTGDSTGRADAGATPPTPTISTQPDDVDEGGA
jgi:hypothetical protein